MAVNFYLDKRTDKNGDCAIRVSISIFGARFVSSTGYKTPPQKWDDGKQQVKKGATAGNGLTYSTINAALAKMAEHFMAYENRCRLENYRPTKEEIKREMSANFIRQRVAEPVGQGVFHFFSLFVEECAAASQWTLGTREKFTAFEKHLKEFNPNLHFSDFSERGLNSFVAFLRDKLKMRNTTIAKQLGFLKWFLRWATAKGHNTTTDFQYFAPKLKTTGKKVIFLEWEELMRVFEYSVPENGTKVKLRAADGRCYEKVVSDAAALRKTRDIFCFCCFTSLRYSDAANLKCANIDGDAMTITTIKTADTLRIELNKYAKRILERYKAHWTNDGFVFPHLTNQRMNFYLKELCELCEINTPVTETYYRGVERVDETHPKFELMSTHAGRRTFICNALMMGISAEIVMKWTGHSDYKSMKPYIDVTNTAKAEAMRMFDER